MKTTGRGWSKSSSLSRLAAAALSTGSRPGTHLTAMPPTVATPTKTAARFDDDHADPPDHPPSEHCPPTAHRRRALQPLLVAAEKPAPLLRKREPRRRRRRQVNRRLGNRGLAGISRGHRDEKVRLEGVTKPATFGGW
jgi:hypothetical protein